MGIEIFPLDIRRIRQGLGFSQKMLGQAIAIQANLLSVGPIPNTRVNEWERRVRPVPDYVFTACASILIAFWAKCRLKVDECDLPRIDQKFAALLNPALAVILSVEHALVHSKGSKAQSLRVTEARQELQGYLESMLSVSMAAVFNVNPAAARNPSHK